jgi:hypothetical protein
MSYFGYHNWRAHGRRVTLHRGDCSHCRDGQGQKGGTDPANGRWLGPFTSEPAAVAGAQRTGDPIRRCRVCL